MKKFVYRYEKTDECTYSFQDYISFESESKELLVVELTCSLLDFQTNCEKTQKELKILNEKMKMARNGKHKIKPNPQLLQKLYLEERKLNDSLLNFEFKGKKYDFSNFSYYDNDKKKYELIDIGNNLMTLNEWFDSHK